MDSSEDMTRAYEDLKCLDRNGWFWRSLRLWSVAKAISEPPGSFTLKSYRRSNLSVTKLPRGVENLKHVKIDVSSCRVSLDCLRMCDVDRREVEPRSMVRCLGRK